MLKRLVQHRLVDLEQSNGEPVESEETAGQHVEHIQWERVPLANLRALVKRDDEPAPRLARKHALLGKRGRQHLLR